MLDQDKWVMKPINWQSDRLATEQAHRMPRVLLISHCVPPVPFGPSFVFLRLFKHFPKDSYVVYTTHYEVSSSVTIGKLPCPYYYAPAHTIYSGYTRWSSIKEWLEVLPIAWKGLKIIRREKISVLLVYPTAGNFLLAAYLMHKISNVPIAIYMLDCFSAVHTYKLRKYLSGFIERVTIHGARNVFVMSEALQEYYEAKYGITSTLLPHPLDVAEDLDRSRNSKLPNRELQKTIVFTGMIYEAQIDSIVNLVNAIKDIGNIEFHIYSQRSSNKLVEIGITGNNVIHHGFVSQQELSKIHKDADLLFLPMAFVSPYAELIQTASPSKLPEYLASGRPILVHAPADAYISWYAKKYGWGEVVDQPDTDLLKEAVRSLLNDENRCEVLVENAKKALDRHRAAYVAGALKKDLGFTSER